MALPPAFSSPPQCPWSHQTEARDDTLEILAHDGDKLSDYLSRLLLPKIPRIDNVLRRFVKNSYNTPFTLTIEPPLDPHFVESVALICKKFPHTVSLILKETGIHLEELNFLFSLMPHLETLHLKECPHLRGNKAVMMIPPTLKIFMLEKVPFTDGDLNEILKCRKLEAITLVDCKDVSLEPFAHVYKRFPLLTSLELETCALKDRVLPLITKLFPNIEHLSLSNCKMITAKGFQEIPLPPHVRELIVSKTKINCAGLVPMLKQCPKLEILDLESCDELKPDSFLMLPLPDTLLEFHAPNTQIDPAGVRHVLSRCSKLELINLEGCENLPDACQKCTTSLQTLLDPLEQATPQPIDDDASNGIFTFDE